MAEVINNSFVAKKGWYSSLTILGRLFARFNLMRDSYMRDQNHLQRMYEYSPAKQHVPYRVWKRHGAMLQEMRRQRH